MKPRKKIMNQGLVILLLLSFSFLQSCKKLVEVKAPVTSINSSNVYENDATAAAVLTGIYTQMSGADFLSAGISSLSLYTGLSADEFSLYDAIEGTPQFYYKNSLTNINTGSTDYWSIIYPIIFSSNSAIQGLNKAKSLTPSVQQQLLGESKFIRAFCFFYLVNLYGDVPLTTSTDYKINSVLSRTDEEQIYDQIVNDLKDAEILLNSNYLDGTLSKVTTERVRPNKWAAIALLARVYLYRKDYSNAEKEATNLINNKATYDTVPISDVFLKNSNEAIWQLQPVYSDQNTQDAWVFILPDTGPDYGHPVFLNPTLLNSFEITDERKIFWIDSVQANGNTYYFPRKYKSANLGDPVTEYEMVLRLAEQYLIRAEAEANGAPGGINSAISDLNVIRNRAGLANYSGPSDASSVLNAIYHERQVELFTEWGHRWLDLKRTQNIDSVMNIVAPQKGGNWNTAWGLFPIPISELKADPNLIQNPGY